MTRSLINSEGSCLVSTMLKHFKSERVRLFRKRNSVVYGIREHVRLGPKISETPRGKLSFGVRLLQLGEVDKVYKQLFTYTDEEKLLNASQCYLYTTAGPIAGLLFISTNKVAFCSERPIKISSLNGDLIRAYCKAFCFIRRPEEAAVKRADNICVCGNARGRGRPRLTWESVVHKDMQSLGLSEHVVLDRTL